jgi:hypothetical protein
MVKRPSLPLTAKKGCGLMATAPAASGSSVFKLNVPSREGVQIEGGRSGRRRASNSDSTPETTRTSWTPSARKLTCWPSWKALTRGANPHPRNMTWAGGRVPPPGTALLMRT